MVTELALVLLALALSLTTREKVRVPPPAPTEGAVKVGFEGSVRSRVTAGPAVFVQV